MGSRWLHPRRFCTACLVTPTLTGRATPFFRRSTYFNATLLLLPSTMDSLDNSDWDVLIVGTGLQQALLAL